MRRVLSIVFAMALAAPAAATHVPGLSEDEESCQQSVAKALGGFPKTKIKCLVKCDKGAAKGKNPDSDCAPPFGGKTAGCVTAAETKAATAPAKKCTDDCPECYAAADCPAFTAAQVALAEAFVDTSIPEIACDDSASDDGLTEDERKCRQAAANEAGKVSAAAAKCLAKCRAAEHKGKLPPGACDQGPEFDPKTSECLDKALLKCLLTAEKKCSDPPECLGDLFFSCFLPALTVLDFDPIVFCASPSGAFVDGVR
jgi:hypothetical protein